MINKIIILTAVFSLCISFQSIVAEESYGARGAQQGNDISIQQMLIYAIQDEYLARAEYEAIIKKHGNIRPFSNIIKSEVTHINMLIPLFKKYGYPVPEDTSSGHVVIPEDIKTSFETCVQAEVDNIAMYEKFLKQKLPDDIRDTFIRLRDASKNHLRAFSNGLKRY